jgi:succinyl-CoA synthetase beta subunit
MKLLEHEGKTLLAKHGISIPAGALWPTPLPAASAGWVVKAQVFAGGRGKRGGIQFASTSAEIARIALAMQGSTFGDETVHAVYVEERLDIARELYLAAFIDRDRGRVAMIASASGGVEIESAAKEAIARIEVDPLIGLAGFQIRQLRRALALTPAQGAEFEKIVAALYAALVGEDAELAEINPLAVTGTGALVAADAKIVLDDDAAARHPARGTPVAWTADSAFMRRCRDLDAIGVDNRARISRPGVAVLGNGAGLTMATYDLVALAGVDVAGAIELHGALARGIEHTADVIGALFMLEADVYLINAFYQLRSTDALAQALVMALERARAPERSRIVVRMRGVNQQASQKIVEDAGCFYTPSLREAAARALDLARNAETRGAS